MTEILAALAGILLPALLMAQFILFRQYKRNRIVFALGVEETFYTAVTTSLLASFGLIALIDVKFCSCQVYLAWGLVAVCLVWQAFLSYMQRFQKLYRKNQFAKTLEEEFSGWKLRLVRFSVYCLGNTPERKRRRRIRNSIPIVIGVAALLVYSILQPDQSPSADTLDTFEECWTATLTVAGVMMLVAGLYIYILLGVVIDVAVQSSKGDALGIKTMLKRCALVAICSMFVFGPLLILALLHVIPSRWVFGSLLPFILMFHVLVISLPLLRAMRDEQKKRGHLANSDLSFKSKQALMGNKRRVHHEDSKVKNKEIPYLEDFILSSEGFQAMKTHLTAELGVESLYFIVRAVAYSQKFQGVQVEKYESNKESGLNGSVLFRPSNARVGHRRSSLGSVSELSDRGFEDIDQSHKQLLTMEEQKNRALQLMERRKTKNSGQDSLKNEDKNSSGEIDHSTEKAETQGANPDYDDMLEECLAIYEKHISPHSEMEVNLPAKMHKRFTGIKKLLKTKAESDSHSVVDANVPGQVKFVATPDIFEDCVLEVVTMLYYDSFRRFLKDPEKNKLWKGFLEQALELEALEAQIEESETVN